MFLSQKLDESIIPYEPGAGTRGDETKGMRKGDGDGGRGHAGNRERTSREASGWDPRASALVS